MHQLPAAALRLAFATILFKNLGEMEDARCHESWEALFLLEATFSTVDARSQTLGRAAQQLFCSAQST